MREAIDPPPDIAIVVETGCFACDGPATGLVRVYRDQSGAVRSDVLFDVSKLGLPARHLTGAGAGQDTSPYITGIATGETGAEMAVSVCVDEVCENGGLDGWSAGARTILYRSHDGGVSWDASDRINKNARVIGLYYDERALMASYPARLASPVFYLYPGEEIVQSPADADGWPLTVQGQVFWRTADGRLLFTDGSEFLRLSPDPPSSELYIVDAFGSVAESKGELVVVWSSLTGFETKYRAGVFDVLPDGTKPRARLTSGFETDEPLFTGAWLPKQGVLVTSLGSGNTQVPVQVPVQVDLLSGDASPIPHPFSDADFALPNRRNQVRVALQGPFARAEKPGACVNLYDSPSTSNTSAECIADRVLVRDIGETEQAEGVTWAHVMTPSGLLGWVDNSDLAH